MEERLELLQRQQPFPPLGDLSMGLSLTPDSDYLEVARTRSESSDHSSPNITPRASNHSNMSVSELGSSANEHDEGGSGSGISTHTPTPTIPHKHEHWYRHTYGKALVRLGQNKKNISIQYNTNCQITY